LGLAVGVSVLGIVQVRVAGSYEI